MIQIANKSTELMSQECILSVVTEIPSLGQAVQSTPNNLVLQYIRTENLKTTKRATFLKSEQFQTLIKTNTSSQTVEQLIGGSIAATQANSHALAHQIAKDRRKQSVECGCRFHISLPAMEQAQLFPGIDEHMPHIANGNSI